MALTENLNLQPQSERGKFRFATNTIINRLSQWEKEFVHFPTQERESSFYDFRRSLYDIYQQRPKQEKLLFESMLDLFALKNQIGQLNEIWFSQLQKKPEGQRIEFLASLGNGKTVIAEAFKEDLYKIKPDSKGGEIIEPVLENPFWSKSFNDSSYMFRSQLFYLLSNIGSEIKARLEKGVSVSDTSFLTDAFLWVEWHHQNGRLDDQEYEIYHKLIALFKPIIPTPDLLVILQPDSIDHLKEGIKKRGRSEEQVFTEDDNQELAHQVEITKSLIESIPRDWGIKVLPLTVNPLEIFDRETNKVNYSYIYDIREALGLLGHLLHPSPQETATEMMRILSKPGLSKAIILHSKSMFSGKTTAECLLADMVGYDKVLAFQPKAALRNSETGFEDQEKHLISRSGLKIKAVTIEDNSLKSIISFIRDNNNDSKKQPYIFIDDVMLFLAQKDNPQEAIDALEELRKMGFHVIADGIDYTFQEEPFTFMHNLLGKVKKEQKEAEGEKRNPNWYQIETHTRCRWCNKHARGTRLYRINEHGQQQIMPYGYDFRQPGSLLYEPACCEEHNTCTDQPVGFKKSPLPTETKKFY